MGSIKSIPMTIDEVCESLADGYERALTRQLLELFISRGGSYLVSATNPNRIYCYIKKSAETMIINKQTYVDRQPDGGYSLQIRIQNAQTFDALDSLSDNVRAQILGGRDCKMPHCCGCGRWYTFTYNKAAYQKCHMLCDNFHFSGLTAQDTESIMTILSNEWRAVGAKKRAPQSKQ